MAGSAATLKSHLERDCGKPERIAWFGSPSLTRIELLSCSRFRRKKTAASGQILHISIGRVSCSSVKSKAMRFCVSTVRMRRRRVIRCGAILVPVRWTILGEPGAWCSRRCRDGVDHPHQPGVCLGCGTSLGGKRRGAIYCNRTCRMRKVRRSIEESANIVNTPIVTKGLAGAISVFGYRGTRTALDPKQESSDACELRP
jgi:hypothetical protein